MNTRALTLGSEPPGPSGRRHGESNQAPFATILQANWSGSKSPNVSAGIWKGNTVIHRGEGAVRWPGLRAVDRGKPRACWPR